MAKSIERSTYLQKDFDYTKLTKDQLRSILFENNVQNIPPITERKSVYLDLYKNEIYNQIEALSKVVDPDGSDIEHVSNFSSENMFQSPKRPSTDEKDAFGDKSFYARQNKKSSTIEDAASERSIDMSSKPKNRLMISIKKKSPKNAGNVKNPIDEMKKTTHLQSKGPMLASITNSKSHAPEMSVKSPIANQHPKIHPRKISGTDTCSPGNKRSSYRKAPADTIRKPTIETPLKKKKEGRPSIKGKHERSSRGAVSSQSSESSIVEDTFDHSYLVNTPSRIKKSKFEPFIIEKSSRVVFLVYAFIAVYVYFRFFCPYCTENKLVCIPIPQNSFLENGILRCKSGFMLKRGFGNKCENVYLDRLRNGVSIKEAESGMLRVEGVYVDSGVARIHESGFAVFKKNMEIAFVISEIPFLILLLFFTIKNQKRRNRRIKLAIENEGRRSLDALIKMLKDKCKEGKIVPVSAIRQQFGSDSRVWSIVLQNIKNRITERNGIIDGKQTRVWEWCGEV